MAKQRSGGLGALMLSIVKSQADYKLGRINFIPSGYDFSSDGTVNKQRVFLRPIKDAEGADASINWKQSTSNCENGELYYGEYPMFTRGKDKDTRFVFYIPRSVCRKCQYYIKPKPGKKPRFACCAYLQERRANAPEPLVQLTTMMGRAADKAKAVLGGGVLL